MKEDKLTHKEVWDRREKLLSTKKPLYTQKEIMNLLEEDKFKFSFSGHVNDDNQWAIKDAKRSIISSLEFIDMYHNEMITELELAKSKGEDYQRKEGLGAIKLADIDKELAYYKNGLKSFEERKIKETGQIDWMNSREFYCFKCGMKLDYILLDENTIGLGATTSMNKEDIWDCTCPFKDGAKGHSYYITVPTGELVFANYFDDRKPYTEADKDCDCYANSDRKEMEIFEPKDKWNGELSLNTHAGRIGLMNHYSSKHNIAFGQMGNMSVGIYIKKGKKDRIVISSAYLSDRVESDDKELASKSEKFLKEYRLLGCISLEVWRWMAADMSILKKNKIPIKLAKKGDYGDENILVKVKKGKWKVAHQFRTDDCDQDKDLEYSILEFENETK